LRVQVGMRALAVSEFDLGAVASQRVTDAGYRAFLDAIVHAPSLTMIVQASRSLMQQDQVVAFLQYQQKDLKRLPAAAKDNLFAIARSGFRVAAVFAGHEVSTLLNEFGYTQAVSRSETSSEVAAAWSKYFETVLSSTSCAIVIGHDFDPLFSFSAI
jgi:hypothetical protein